MNKQILFIITVLLTVCNFLVSATNTADILSENQQSSSNKIDLRGELPPRGGFRSGTDPIVAELQGNMLSIRFQKDVGVLQVTVTGPQGHIYTTAINTATPSVLSIPLLGLPAGNYMITFSGEKGMMWGEFEV